MLVYLLSQRAAWEQQPHTLPGSPRRSVYGEGQGERSAEIIYKHITKFHYFYFVDSGT